MTSCCLLRAFLISFRGSSDLSCEKVFWPTIFRRSPNNCLVDLTFARPKQNRYNPHWEVPTCMFQGLSTNFPAAGGGVCVRGGNDWKI